MYVSVYLSIFVYACVCLCRLYLSMLVYVCLCLCMFVYIRLCLCMFVHICVCLCVLFIFVCCACALVWCLPGCGRGFRLLMSLADLLMEPIVFTWPREHPTLLPSLSRCQHLPRREASFDHRTYLLKINVCMWPSPPLNISEIPAPLPAWSWSIGSAHLDDSATPKELTFSNSFASIGTFCLLSYSCMYM